MKLNHKSVWDNNDNWKELGVKLPKFDYNTVKQNTLDNPEWIHFGAGNIFRAFQCALHQELLNNDFVSTGIIVAEGFDYEIIEKAYKPYDNNGILVTLKANGETEKTIISSVVESLTVNQENANDFKRLKQIFSAPSLKMVSFTITEKGYSLHNLNGDLYDNVKIDITHDIDKANSYLGKLVSLLHIRYQAGRLPIALVSMDNVSHNGDRLREAVLTLAEKWYENSFVDEDFVEYLKDDKLVSYPWTMIDKITPRPDDGVKNDLISLGFKDANPVVTSRGTYIAPFVNAEESQYLVIEDNFPNGKLPLDKAGVIYTDRDTIDKVERMKVTTCLNPLHTALAIFGCLLGYTKISDEMKDKHLTKLISKIGYEEGLPVVVNPGIIEPKSFINEVINVRFPNPFMPDTPQRIATDTSQKLSIRYLETVKAYMNHPELNVESLEMIPLVIAGWIRYLMGVDDNGDVFELSSDPLLEDLKPLFKDIKLGANRDTKPLVREILLNSQIFSINLYEIGLGEKVELYFDELVQGPNAVRNTLNKYLGDI